MQKLVWIASIKHYFFEKKKTKVNKKKESVDVFLSL